MHSFLNDYSHGAHPDILSALLEHGSGYEPAYGLDAATREAEALITAACKAPHSKVHFVTGGTQANLVVCAALLRPHESIIAADTGHILHYEAGAIEATGHKVHSVGHREGKLTVDDLLPLLKKLKGEHCSKPRLLYLSQTTELGAVYSPEELESLAQVARDQGLLIYVDGARLGSALASKAPAASLEQLAQYVDIFTIGGTKNGALFGEAIVICNSNLQGDFRWHLKQRGALLAPGRALGIQFRRLFQNNLFIELAKVANEKAIELARVITEAGYELRFQPVSNQIFPVFSNQLIQSLKIDFSFYEWESFDEEHSVVRLVCSWATPDSSLVALSHALRETKVKSGGIHR